MPNEIKYPAERTYYVAHDENGDVLHVGYTEPNQVTTTGQSVLDAGSRALQVDVISQFRESPAAWNYEWDGEQWTFPGDDVFYVPAAPHIAEPLSRALFALIYGESKQGLYANIIPHPSGQAHSLLQCRNQDTIPLALGADPQPLADVLAITVADGALTQQELDGIVSAVQSMAGQVVNLVDFIPASWQPYVMTKEQAIAAGYFGDLP